MELDNMFRPALQLVLEYKLASPAMLQRKLKLGYMRAMRIITSMELLGIIGERSGTKPAPILANSMQEVDALLNKEEEKKTFKVIIAGGRDFKDYNLLIQKCQNILKDKKNVEIVSGGQQTVDKATGEVYGADFLGESFAAREGYKLTVFPADWDAHGKAAGPIRNKKMAEYSNALILFWDGKSRGSRNMKTEAQKLKLVTRIIRY